MSRKSAAARRSRRKDDAASAAHLPDTSCPASPVDLVSLLNQAATPSSLLDCSAKMRRSGFHLTTSTELLKILNRTWSLEEQHASTVSLVKSLNMELKHARSRIRELVREDRSHRHEMGELLKQVVEDKLVRKSKEHGRIDAAVQSIRDELEDEKRLRRHSESLHRRLVRELADAKSECTNAAGVLARRNETNAMLEELCDELAKGIVEYEQEVHELRHKLGNISVQRSDKFVLRISEAWLGERSQVKNSGVLRGPEDRGLIIDRLSTGELRAFLRDRGSNNSKRRSTYPKDRNETDLRRVSLESLRLNGATSAPQPAEDDDSYPDESHCFELNTKHGHIELRASEMRNEILHSVSSIRNKKMSFSKKIEEMPCLRSKYGEQRDGSEIQAFVDDLERRIEGAYQVGEDASQDLSWRSRCLAAVAAAGTGGGDQDASGEFCMLSSRVRRWSCSSAPAPGLVASSAASSSSRLPRGVKENTLKAKLLEARLEGKHARLKACRGSSVAAGTLKPEAGICSELDQFG